MEEDGGRSLEQQNVILYQSRMSCALERRRCQLEISPYVLWLWSVDTAEHSETLCVNNWWMKVVRLSTLCCIWTKSFNSNHQLRERWSLFFLKPQFPVTLCFVFCFLLCLLAGQWGNVYSIPSNHVLVSPQEHRGELYPRQDLEINGSPLSMWSHQIVCSVSKEVNYNFKIDCQELWPSLWLV